MLGSTMLGPHTRLYGVVLVLLAAGLVWTLGLTGCGPASSPAVAQGDTTGSDVLLFPTEEVPVEKAAAKADRPGDKDQDITPKAVLNTLGTFQSFNPAEWDVEYHSFQTKAGNCYQIEFAPTGDAWDDLDLYVGRDPDPYWNTDFVSARYAPYPDSLVFKANQTGTMYIAVSAYDDGGTDGYCPYVIHVRQCWFGTFTG